MSKFLTLALAGALLMVAGEAQARQTGPLQQSPVAAARQDLPAGLAPQAVRDWLITQGLNPDPIATEPGNPYVRVVDGQIVWLLMFLSCVEGICGDFQFSVAIDSPLVTPDHVNAWNRDHRFLKAFYQLNDGVDAGGTAVAQYDVFARAGAGPEQLNEPLAVWRGLAVGFVRHLVPPATPATPPQDP